MNWTVFGTTLVFTQMFVAFLVATSTGMKDAERLPSEIRMTVADIGLAVVLGSLTKRKETR